ncbi:hypothetical protein [Leifsonia soli]|uniref:Uncharacterized protein n=1 Tax=Leifsonia soli TaxID=582665 RepID=A0A852T0R8_9MICO|nr:hypothetical protein [Leifsonia soli]NYD75136.1 hypothetical protein [Leifsonia soli]
MTRGFTRELYHPTWKSPSFKRGHQAVIFFGSPIAWVVWVLFVAAAAVVESLAKRQRRH